MRFAKGKSKHEKKTKLIFHNFMRYGNIELVKFSRLVLIVFLFFNFVFAQELPEEGQVYVCPLATKMEEINPRCDCRIDLILGKTVTSTCLKNNQTYEMTLTISEYEGKEYYVIYGFENGGAGVNFTPQAKISGSFEGFVGEPLSFSGANSSDPNGDLLDFYWDFGDGSFSREREVTHIYNLPGNYILSLRVSDGLAFSTATTSVIINEKPANIVILPPSTQIKTKGEMKTEEKIVEGKEEEEQVKERIENEGMKFLVPTKPTNFLNIPIDREVEKEEIKKEKSLPTIEKQLKKEALLASLSGILKRKILVNFGILIFLIFIMIGILKFKNYFCQRKNKIK